MTVKDVMLKDITELEKEMDKFEFPNFGTGKIAYFKNSIDDVNKLISLATNLEKRYIDLKRIVNSKVS